MTELTLENAFKGVTLVKERRLSKSAKMPIRSFTTVLLSLKLVIQLQGYKTLLRKRAWMFAKKVRKANSLAKRRHLETQNLNFSLGNRKHYVLPPLFFCHFQRCKIPSMKKIELSRVETKWHLFHQNFRLSWRFRIVLSILMLQIKV